MADSSTPIARLLGVMARLRSPDGGCPWDLQQTFSTIAPYPLEEGDEVAVAGDAGDREQFRDELGDLLFQVVFHSPLAQGRGANKGPPGPAGRRAHPESALDRRHRWRQR